MELSSVVLGNGFRFHSNRPINNSGQIAAPQLGRVTLPVSSIANATTHTQVWSKSANASKLSKSPVASRKTKESAIQDIQHSSNLESALSRCCSSMFAFLFLLFSVFFLATAYILSVTAEFSRSCWFLCSKSANICRHWLHLGNLIGLWLIRSRNSKCICKSRHWGVWLSSLEITYI